jgi:iron complex outermembrane receptor protein
MGFNLDCAGVEVFIDQSLDDVAPVSLLAFNTYTCIYATDTFDVPSQLSITVGARYNIAQITSQDETGGGDRSEGQLQVGPLDGIC